ncbi:methyltransferase domain-containing protein [Infundibulicybe gibba]|nr:methyltransferase domain-containing protein [Infundibulicybe gibba]
MPGVWQRHPRYSIFVFVVLATTFYLLNPYQQDIPQFRPSIELHDKSLPGRLSRADKTYAKLLRDRQALIKKFGPTPKDVALFPPDVEPWPPYTVWDFFPPAYNCPHEVERLGALGDGGKWVCGLSRVESKPDCVVYSFGINYESSFEAEILANTENCEIWGYDFSVKSFGPQIPSSLAHRTHFHAFGLSGSDKHGPADDPKMYTLDSLMKMNGHTHIDILKIDIEGWEFETVTTLVKSYLSAGLPLPFGQLQLEIHIWNKSFAEFLTWWETLEEAGLRPFWTEPNLVYQNYNKQGTSDLAEYSFLNIKGNNVFIKDPQRAVRHEIDAPQ